MTPITWTTSFEDFAALHRWLRRVMLQRSRPWLVPYAVTVGATAGIAALAGTPMLAAGLVAGGAGWWLALQYLHQKHLAFEPNVVVVDASGIHTRHRDDPACATRFGWAGSDALVPVRGGAVLDAGFGAWLFVPERAATPAQIEAFRASATPFDAAVPDGFGDWRLTYRVDRSLVRPVVRKPVPRQPMPAGQRVLTQILGSVVVMFVVVEGGRGRLSAPGMSPLAWGVVGLVASALALLGWLYWAQRQPWHQVGDRQAGIGEWRFAAGERGIWFGSATATMTQGWNRVAGAHRDEDRLILELGPGFRPLPVSAFASDAEAERLVEYVQRRVGAPVAPRAVAAPPPVARAQPDPDAGPYAAPRD